MAELLSPNEIFYTAYEPKMANRFIMYVEGIPSYLIKAASRPSIDQGEVILDHINVERKLKEHIWDKVEKEWKLTSRVTESMFKGGDIEPTTEEVARQYFPEAFKI